MGGAALPSTLLAAALHSLTNLHTWRYITHFPLMAVHQVMKSHALVHVQALQQSRQGHSGSSAVPAVHLAHDNP